MAMNYVVRHGGRIDDLTQRPLPSGPRRRPRRAAGRPVVDPNEARRPMTDDGLGDFIDNVEFGQPRSHRPAQIVIDPRRNRLVRQRRHRPVEPRLDGIVRMPTGRLAVERETHLQPVQRLTPCKIASMSSVNGIDVIAARS